MLKIGITGHRKLFNPKLVQKEIKVIIERILKEHNTTQFIAYSALASGSDTLFAQMAVSEFNAKLVVYLPFDKDEYLKDFNNEEEKDKFNKLIAQSIEVQTITNGSPTTKEQRNTCYLKCGKALSDNVDALIAIWDEFPASGVGGTGDIVIYFNKKNEDSKKEAYHLLASQTQLQDEYQKRDRAAKKIKRKYINLWQSGLIFSIIAVALLAVSIAFYFHKEPIYSSIKLIEITFLIATIGVAIYSTSIKAKYHWIQTRRESEFLRAVERILKAGLSLNENLKRRFVERSKKLTAHISVELTPILEVVNYGINQSNQNSFDAQYTHLILNTLIDDQIKYHTKRITECKKKVHTLEIYILVIKLLFFLCVAVELIEAVNNAFNLHFLHNFCHSIGSWAIFGILFLPALYAALEGFAYFHEWNKNHIDSINMKEFFELQKTEIERVKTEGEFNNMANTIFERMDSENYAWTLVFEEKSSRIL
jgi:hypothetical protein